ncbi:unnamed protein product [Didymodactylos carnosus]|uniref:Uncharacterized protein n=1 Tax=Didymodactylos carnosus TaxID=1234261 RepID=A0A8S2IAR8_9BILA|nr:unnamed protein product [Didymodactylos carnosus]CAF3736808.1 unnamed protein product [Didymodactylos carnosus]
MTEEPSLKPTHSTVDNYAFDIYDLFNDIDVTTLNLPIIKNSKPDITTSIPLSQSVGIMPVSPYQLQILFPLEEMYRPRYKSDYFPESGNVRKPRYVSDSVGNHFISLKIPTVYFSNPHKKYIRIDWVTVPRNGQRYYMPYQFQTENDKYDVPDENPTHIEINGDNMKHYIMKLYLVLIKSKQNALKNTQRLKPFDTIINETETHSLTQLTNPKALINQFQLIKSQLAFTLCTKNEDNTMRPYWQSTVFSNVMTEDQK